MDNVQKQIVKSNYGRCRCCLEIGYHQNNCKGKYDEILKECLHIFLATDAWLTQLMCDTCVMFLREVQKFRDTVTASQIQLLSNIDKETVFVDAPEEEALHNDLNMKEEMNSVKIEEEVDDELVSSLCAERMLDVMTVDNHEPTLKTESDGSEDFMYDMDTLEDAETEIKCEDSDTILDKLRQNKSMLSKTSANIRHVKNGRRKSLNKRPIYDTESDEPISMIKEKKANVKKKSRIKEKLEATLTTSHSKQDALKDNNKIRANIKLLLKHSTILPFRNNFKTTYKCLYCDKLYIPFRELKEHIESEHVDICEKTIDKCLRSMQDLILSADISLIRCRLCQEEFKTIENLIEHLTNIHKKMFHNTVKKPSHGILGFNLSSDNLKCHICDKNFAFFKNLSIHMNEHYGLFVCYVCGKKFLSEHRYKCHVFNHHETKETKCKHCGENFKTEASMAYHIKKEHLKRTITCPQCPETFPFTQYIKRLNHMAVVHGIKKPVFKCDTCGREYANSGSLAAHKRYTHKRTKEHRCEICGYITVHNTVMKNHMDVHNGVKNYECEFCKKKFAKPYTLKLHLKIHLNDKRFVCSICDAAFIQKNSLKNHLKARHPESGIDLSKL